MAAPSYLPNDELAASQVAGAPSIVAAPLESDTQSDGMFPV
jgi:hypothetical protein